MMCAHGTCHGPQGQSKNLFIFEFLTMCTGLNTRDSCVHTFSSIFHLSSQLSISVILQHSSCLMCHLATCQLDTFVFSLISNVFFSFVFLSYTFTPLHFTCHQHHVGPTTQNHNTMTNGPMEIAVLAMLNFHHLPPMSLPFLLSYTYPTQPWALNDPR
jgi:hypothetical protein